MQGEDTPKFGLPNRDMWVSQYILDAPAEQRVVTERGLTRLSYPRFDRCRRPLKRAIQYSRAPMIDPRGRGVLDIHFRLPEPPAGTLPPDADGRPASKLLSRGMTTRQFADFQREAFFAAALAFFFTPLPSASSASRTRLNSCNDALSVRGNRKFSVSSVLTIAEPITTRANHL